MLSRQVRRGLLRVFAVALPLSVAVVWAVQATCISTTRRKMLESNRAQLPVLSSVPEYWAELSKTGRQEREAYQNDPRVKPFVRHVLELSRMTALIG